MLPSCLVLVLCSGMTWLGIVTCWAQGVKCEIVSADSYYMSPPPDVNPADHNFDEPDALELGLLAQHLQKLKVQRCSFRAATPARLVG